MAEREKTSSMLNLSDLKREASHLKRNAERVFHRLRTPIRPDEMRSALDRLTEGGREIMFVHASLSTCGHFTAGAGGALRGLGECCDILSFSPHPSSFYSSPRAARGLLQHGTE